HNTTVELIDRTEARGAIARTRDAADRRQVFIEITPAGEQIVALVAERIQDAAQELNGAASERDETHDATAAPTETGVAMSA
ncbi:MAG: winged helix DNA-binding protein, partial [Acidobacteriaceae bacterium]|nr:winged helix DNA-binding protein [Acidobacteriaceae bacterium]